MAWRIRNRSRTPSSHIRDDPYFTPAVEKNGVPRRRITAKYKRIHKKIIRTQFPRSTARSRNEALVSHVLLLFCTRNFDRIVVWHLPDCMRIQARSRSNYRFAYVCIRNDWAHCQWIFRHQIYRPPIDLRRNIHRCRRLPCSITPATVVDATHLHLPARPRLRSRLSITHSRHSGAIRRSTFESSHQHSTCRLLRRFDSHASRIRTCRHAFFSPSLANLAFNLRRIFTFMRVPAGLCHTQEAE